MSLLGLSLDPSVQVIAEVKTKSPFGFRSKYSWEDLFQVANDVGEIIAIHTDERWGGSFDLISRAKKLTRLPILAKGIHENDRDIEKALECGADYVLAVGRIPNLYISRCFIEPNSLEELTSFIPQLPENARVVWNSRDLRNGYFKKETFEQAREIWSGYLCQASNIKSVEDVKPGTNAVLVGSYLKEFADSITS